MSGIEYDETMSQTQRRPYRVREFAKATGLHPETVRRKLRANIIHGIPISTRLWLIPHAEYEALMRGERPSFVASTQRDGKP